MKKIIIILMAIMFAVSCQTRYEFEYTLKYTVGDRQEEVTGKVVTKDANSVPIAVAYKNSVVVDTYPTGNDGDPIVLYQGETPARIDSLGYRLTQYYVINSATGTVWDRTVIIKEEEKE